MTISVLPRSFRARLVGAGLIVGAVVLGLLFITNLLLIERYLDHQTNARTEASHDPLTQVFNRRAFETHLQAVLGDSAAHPVVVLYIDLDQFKAVNDSCGHAAGDELLVGIAQRLSARVGRRFLARLGGDEFGVVLTGVDETHGAGLAAEIIAEVRGTPFIWEGRSYRVGASIGVASSKAAGLSPKALMIAADTACFGAKELGRNRVRLFDPNEEYFRQRDEDLRAISHIDEALAAGRFVLPMAAGAPGLDAREAALLARLAGRVQPLVAALGSRMDQAALQRLWSRGLVMIAGATPSDAAHVLGRLSAWDGEAAEKALALIARRRSARGERIAAGAAALATRIIDQLTAQTVDCLLETALAEDGLAAAPADSLLRAALAGHSGTLRLQAALGVPLIGLGASAASYYGAVGARLHMPVILPADGDVANAIGAVVGRVSMHAEALVSSPGPGRFVAHLPDGPVAYPDPEAALAALAPALEAEARAAALAAGLPDPQVTRDEQPREALISGQTVFIEARLRITASGRPRQARD